MGQEEGCNINKQSLPEVLASNWAMSLQDCLELQVVESRALPSDSPAMELKNIITKSCGAHKVGPLIGSGTALACTECQEGASSNLALSAEGSPDSDDLNVYTNPFLPNISNLFNEPPTDDPPPPR